MVRCAAFGCKSGYDSSSHGSDSCEEKITYHSFPIHNKELCQKWVRANPRQDFVPTKHSRLCSLHFKASDFIEERTDSNTSRKNQKARVSNSDKPLRRYLRDGVVPSIFPNAPSYLSKAGEEPRKTSTATSSSRFEAQSRRMNELELSFLDSDNVSGLTVTQLADKLQGDEALPTGFTMTIIDDALLITILKLESCIPKITASINVNSDLSIAVTLDDSIVPASQFEDLIQGHVTHLSALINLMARVKS